MVSLLTELGVELPPPNGIGEGQTGSGATSWTNLKECKRLRVTEVSLWCLLQLKKTRKTKVVVC